MNVISHAGPDSSPGYVRHYYIDTSDSFGSEWSWDGVSRRPLRAQLYDLGTRWGFAAGLERLE